MLQKFLCTVLVGLPLVACNIEGAVSELKEKALQESFLTVKKGAEENGGAAVLVKGGQAATLEVTSADSPIKGAKIVIPAGAIPASVEHAAVVIQGTEVKMATLIESTIPVGPTAIITVKKMPGGEEVVLVAKATVTMPYGEKVSAPAAQLHLGLGDAKNKMQVVAIEGSKASDAKKLVSGDTEKLGSFGTAWKVVFDGTTTWPNSLWYKVTKADQEEICVGYLDLTATEAFTNTKVYWQGNGLRFSLNLGVVGTLTMDTGTGPNAIPVSSVETIYASTEGSSFSCQDSSGTAATFSAATFTTGFVNISNFVEAGTGVMSDCAGVGDCTIHTGTAKAIGEFDYTTAAGERVVIMFNGNVPALAWPTF